MAFAYIRADLHADFDTFKRHNEQARESQVKIVFDLGDPWAPYIDPTHPLVREKTEDEQTKDAIIRNAKENPHLLEDTINKTIEAIGEVVNYITILASRTQYRAIKGNSEEWVTIADIAANKKKEMQAAFQQAYGLPTEYWMQEAGAEFLFDNSGAPESFEERKVGVLYLPWKASVDSVRKASEEIQEGDPQKILIMSHDYLTTHAIPQEYKSGMRSMQNEEQVITALDIIAKPGKHIEGFFGHIGPHYEPFMQKFTHKGAKIYAQHVEENALNLIPIL